MKRSIFAAIFTGLSLAVAACAQSLPQQSSAQSRAAIQNAYNRQNAFYARKNVSGAMSVLAPDYVDVNPGRNENRAKYRQTLTSLFRVVQSVNARTRVQSATCSANSCEVRATRHFVARFASARAGRVSVMDTSEVLADLWVRRNGVWLKRRSSVLRSRGTLDGKPMK